MRRRSTASTSRPARSLRSAALFAGVAGRRHRRPRGLGRRRPAPRRAARRRHRRQRRRRHRSRRAAVPRVLHRRPEEGHPLRHPRVDRRHGVERDLDRAAAARHQPRALDGLHELHRRRGLCAVPAARRRVRRAALRRRRRLRDAGHDLRLRADAGDVDALQRHAGHRLAALRSRPRRLRARRGRVDAGARARGDGPGARRDRLRLGRGLRLDVRRLPSRPDGSRRRRDRPRHAHGDRSRRAAGREHRLRQLPRHLDAAERRHRSGLREARLRHATPGVCPDRRPSR